MSDHFDSTTHSEPLHALGSSFTKKYYTVMFIFACLLSNERERHV